MSAKSGNPGGKREAAAVLLAVGRSVRVAAREAGCSERTLRNWLDEESFRGRVQALRAEVFGRATGALCGASVRAARALAKLLGSEDGRIRLGAARSVPEFAPRMREVCDLAAELAALRARVEGATHAH